MDIFEQRESAVQSYARSFPVVFDRAEDAHLFDQEGKRYLDFLAGAGTLNYGHNNAILKERLVEYIEHNGITHGLDMHTRAKAEFLTAFQKHILEPRGLDYLMQFTGPTGTNAVEAALKVARKVTGRQNVIAFTNGFHGVSIGSLAATGNQHHRAGAGVLLSGVSRMPYDGYMDGEIDTVKYLETMLHDASSGVDFPAAIMLEVVQGEGGLNVASEAWLQAIERICRENDILLIVDDIQAGCGRTGTFFSFEPSGIKPDIVTLSKSLSGFGLPFAVTLLRPDLDVWEPGEHNGTFRGNNHAFVTATAAIRHYWQDDAFAQSVQAKGELLGKRLQAIANKYGPTINRKGRGMMQGLCCQDGDLAGAICKHAFDQGLVIETSGPEGEVVKCLCPLTISEAELEEGLNVLADSVDAIMNEKKTEQKAS